MNKSHDYRALEREYITTDISFRELCRRNGVRSHSSVVDQAKKHGWAEKREAYQAKASESFIEEHAARMADRRAEISDKALDLIEEAFDKYRDDMRATKKVRQPDGSITEEPAWLMRPRDVALLIDRLQFLFDRPAHISEGHDISSNPESHRCAEPTRGDDAGEGSNADVTAAANTAAGRLSRDRIWSSHVR